jgi:glycosyltransferase involved in cell wall biosynthesis
MNIAGRMNVLIVHHHAIPPTEPGSTRHFSLARYLVRAGHDVTILCSAFSHHTRTEFASRGGGDRLVASHDGVTFVRLRSPQYKKNDFRRVWNFLSFAFRALLPATLCELPRPSVVLGSSPQPLSALAGLIVARRLAVPFVLEVRDLWPETLCELGGYDRRNPFVRILYRVERLLYSKADEIITLLPDSVPYLCLQGARKERITFIPNGIDRELLPQGQATAPERGPRTVIYAGAHGLANGLDAILRAIRLVEDSGTPVRFRFIGDGPKKPALRDLAASLGLRSVSFEDALPKDRIYGALTEADAFIVNVRDSALYRHGTSLNKVFDYMALGRPTILASNSSNNIIADSGAGICVGADDSASMAAAIVKVVGMSAEERRKMGGLGQEYVQRHHTFFELARDVEGVLARAVERRTLHSAVIGAAERLARE